jgi:hypothetical protein
MFSKAAFSTSSAAFKPANIRRAFLIGVLTATAALGQTRLAQAGLNQTSPNQTGPSQTSPSQSRPEIPASAAAWEFPVVLQQKVIAGKTPVGTKVQAKLAVATLFAGVVIPQDAVLSGEVTQSASKSSADPSRLAIRMDSAQWKNGATPTVIPLTPKLYLTAWYYPAALTENQNSDRNPDAANNPKPWNGGGVYPGQRNPTSPSLSGPDASKDTFPTSTSNISKRRELMKKIESVSDSAGAVILTSTHSNIKLDKSTTYVLAATDLLPAK